MRKVVAVLVGLLLLALAPLVLPITGVVWGVLTLRSTRNANGERAGRRRWAVVAIVGSLVFAALVWPRMGGAGDSDEVAGTPSSTTTSPTSSITPPSTPTSPLTSVASTPVETPADEVAATQAATSSAPPERSDAGVSAASGLVPVVGIVDGDTIRVRIDGRTERVRVIGIDTPELSGDECYARQASSKMQSLAQSRSVRLEVDPTQDDRDRYDRLLRHVFLADGKSAAEVLIAGGFGREYTYAADYRYQDQYRAAEATARSTSKGMWGERLRRWPGRRQRRRTETGRLHAETRAACDGEGPGTCIGQLLHQGQHQRRGRADLSRARRPVLRQDEDHGEQGREVVL